MIFIFNNKIYSGESAVGIVRGIELDTPEYASQSEKVEDFLVWSLARLADAIPPRELEISPHLGDENIAFNYLCLLDNYGIGAFYETRAAALPANEGE